MPLSWVWAPIIAGPAAFDEGGLGRAHGAVKLFVLCASLQPLARGRAEALAHVVDISVYRSYVTGSPDGRSTS